MKNLEMTVNDNKLTIIVDLSKRYGETKSGKSIAIASSDGNISIPDHEEIKIGINVYIKKE